MYKQLKCLLAAGLFVGMTTSAAAGDKEVLYHMIFEAKSMSSSYVQTVFSPEDKILQELKGDLYLLRPNYFRMDTMDPDASTVVADGTNVYSYDEMLEQVTIYSFNQQVANSPLMLIISDDSELWGNYDVMRSSEDTFTVMPKELGRNNIKSMSLTFNKGNIKRLKFIENDGKYSVYNFTPKKDVSLTANDFKYVIPEGITVDDQRSK